MLGKAKGPLLSHVSLRSLSHLANTGRPAVLHALSLCHWQLNGGARPQLSKCDEDQEKGCCV